jgi:Spy/CpxP family protein refolding chaperone
MRWLARCAMAGSVVSLLAGCAAFEPQQTAQQYAPSYYNQSYDQLTPQQKMQLEDHLANQSNQAWRTTAQMASGIGHLAQGAGVLLFAARH